MQGNGRWIATGAIAALVVAGGVTAALRVAPEASTQFITDSAGRSIVAHGFSTASSAKSSADGLPNFTETDLEREQADMGTNFVRFLISWRAIAPEAGVIDEGYLDDVEERVQWYADRGLQTARTRRVRRYLLAIAIRVHDRHRMPAGGTHSWPPSAACCWHSFWRLFILRGAHRNRRSQCSLPRVRLADHRLNMWPRATAHAQL